MENFKKIDKIISYIGSKVKLYDFLEEIILNNYENTKKINFFDLFAGTNAVSNLVLTNKKWNIITNDMHKYSYILSYFLDFNNLKVKERKKIINFLEVLNNLDNIEGDFFNEFSINGIPKSIDENLKDELFKNQPFKSRMFFTEIVGKKIDTVKKGIQTLYNKKLINEIERKILTIFILNYADKNANTASVYGAYLKNNKQQNEKPFLDKVLIQNLRYLNKNYKNNLRHENKDIINILNTFIKEVKYNKKEKNVIYLDPPYNTRSYEGNYHILEYIADYDFNYFKIKKNSKTGQPSETFQNPFRSKHGTIEIFKEMIQKSLELANSLYISYSTDGLVSEKQINEIFLDLKKKIPNLILKTYKKDYKRFKSSNKHDKSLKIKKNHLENVKNKTEIDLENIEKLNKDIEIANKGHKINEVNNLEEIIWFFHIEENKKEIKDNDTIYKNKKIFLKNESLIVSSEKEHKDLDEKKLNNINSENHIIKELEKLNKDELIYIILEQKNKISNIKSKYNLLDIKVDEKLNKKIDNYFSKQEGTNKEILIFGEKKKEIIKKTDRKNGKIIFNLNKDYEIMKLIKEEVSSSVSINIPKNNLFKWIGGKSWLKNNIAYITKNLNHKNAESYIEPFAGGLGSFKAILPFLIENSYKKIILNDINPLIINTFKIIKENPEELIKEYSKISKEYENLFKNEKTYFKKYDKIKKEFVEDYCCLQDLDKTKDKEIVKKLLKNQEKYYYKIREEFNFSKENINEKIVAKFLFLMTYSFNGIYRENKKGEMNSPFNWNNKIDNLNYKIELIKEYNVFFNSLNIIFENLDVFKLLKKYSDNKTFIYLDPPYLNSIEKSENKYNKSIFGKTEQLKLIKDINKYNIVLYSNHFQDVLINLLEKNNFTIFKVLRKNIMSSIVKNRSKDKVEILSFKESF